MVNLGSGIGLELGGREGKMRGEEGVGMGGWNILCWLRSRRAQLLRHSSPSFPLRLFFQASARSRDIHCYLRVRGKTTDAASLLSRALFL